MAETVSVRNPHPERNKTESKSKFEVRRMGLILQQSAGSANLIKLRNHVHPDYGFDLVGNRLNLIDSTLHIGGISLFVAHRHQRRVVRLVECIYMAVKSTHADSTAALAASHAFSAIAIFCGRWDRLGFCNESDCSLSRRDRDRGDPR